MNTGWSFFVTVVTLLTMAGAIWLLVSNRDAQSTGEELDHDFDGITEYDNPLPAWWVGLFIATIVYGVGYVFYYPALGNMKGSGEWSSAKEWLYSKELHDERHSELYAQYARQSPEVLATDRRAIHTGRRLFLNHCSTCHGVAAKGRSGFPNLTDSEWIWGSGFSSIKQTILMGRNGVMPPWESAMTAEQLSAVSLYVQAPSDPASNTSHSESGQSTYTMFCVACHGAQGKGNAALGAPDLTNDAWLYGGSLEQITESIAKGRNGQMPPHGDILGEDKAHLLAAYIYSLQQGVKPAGQAAVQEGQ